MTEDHVILDRLQKLRRYIKHNRIDDPLDSSVIEYRRLLVRLWNVPLSWGNMKDPNCDTRGARFRPRGTVVERIANRLQYGR